MKKLCAINV